MVSLMLSPTTISGCLNVLVQILVQCLEIFKLQELMRAILDGKAGFHGQLSRVRRPLQCLLQYFILVVLVTAIKLVLMDLLSDELVLRGPGDVFDYRTEEALGSYERNEVKLLAETHAALLKYSLSSVLLTAALPAASRAIRMEKLTTDHRLACIKLYHIVIFFGFIFE